MKKSSQRILKLIMVVGIIALLAIIVFGCIMLVGILSSTNECLVRYSGSSSSPTHSSYTTESSTTLNGNGSYDATVNSGGTVVSGTTFGQWKNTHFNVVSGQNVNLNIRGKTSLCKAYLPQYNLESNDNTVYSNGVYTPVAIPRLEDPGDGIEIKFDASSTPYEWRNLTKLSNGDSIIVKIKPNAQPTDTNLTTKYFTSLFTGQEGPYDCSQNQQSYHPVCGRYGLSSMFYYVNACAKTDHSSWFGLHTWTTWSGSSSSQYIMVPYLDSGKANYGIFQDVANAQLQPLIHKDCPNIFLTNPSDPSGVCSGYLFNNWFKYKGSGVSGSDSKVLGWGGSTTGYQYSGPSPISGILAWYVSDLNNYPLGLLQRMDTPNADDEKPTSSKTRGSQYSGSNPTAGPSDSGSGSNSGNSAEGTYNGDTVPVDEFVIANFIPGMGNTILQDQYSGPTRYLQFSFLGTAPSTPTGGGTPPPGPLPQDVLNHIDDLTDQQNFITTLTTYIGSQIQGAPQSAISISWTNAFEQFQPVLSKTETYSGNTLLEDIITLLQNLSSTATLNSANVNSAALTDVQTFLTNFTTLLSALKTDGYGTASFSTALQTFTTYLYASGKPVLFKTEGAAGTLLSNLQTLLNNVVTNLGQEISNLQQSAPTMPAGSPSSQTATGGYIFQIKQTACQRFNGQGATDEGCTNRGAIQYIIVPNDATTDPNSDPSTYPSSTWTTLSVETDGSATFTSSVDGTIWMRIINNTNDYQDSIGQYVVSYQQTNSIDGFGTMTNQILYMLYSIKDSGKQMFAKMTCDPSSGLDVSSCNDFFNYIRAMLTLYIVVFGLMFLLGMAEITVEDLVIRVIKISIVAGLMNGSTFSLFQNYVFDFVLGMSDQLIADITGIQDSVQINNVTIFNPFMFIDEVMSRIFFSPIFVAQMLATFSVGIYGVFYFIIIVVGLIIFIIAVLRSIAVYIMAFTAIALLLGIAPLFLTFMLFNKTYYLFENWSRLLVRYAIEPAILIIGLTILSQLFTVYLDYVLNYSVCWKCALTFKLPFTLPGLPSPFENIGLFCLYWFGAWGLDNSVDLIGMSMSNIVALVMIAYCLNGYINLVGEVVGNLTNTPGAPSATSMGMALSGSIGQKALGTVGLDQRNRDRKLNSFKKNLDERSEGVNKALEKNKANMKNNPQSSSKAGNSSGQQTSGGSSQQGAQAPRAGQHGGAPQQDSRANIPSDQHWDTESKAKDSMDKFLKDRGLTISEDQKAELAKYATLKTSNPERQAKLDSVYDKALNDVVGERSTWSAEDKKAFVKLARTSGKRDSVDLGTLQDRPQPQVTAAVKPNGSPKPQPKGSAGGGTSAPTRTEDID